MNSGSGSDGSTPMMEGGRLLADRYRLLEKIGEGGAAEVFRARDQRLDRMVAIKLLRPQYTHDESSRRRFVQEAKTAAALSHPNVVDIYDFGEAQDGAMFIAMQYIQGQNLKDLLQKRGRLTPAETISIARQACHALAAAHANGLIHRDVKPQNILMDKVGQVHLTDFGIVKALSGPALTQSGMTFGTAAYMSPEQATGAPIKAAADLYSLGCVMYEMLTGMPPFTGDNPAVVAYKQVWEQPRPLHELVPEVPPSLESIVMRLLNKDPGRRYPSTDDLVTDLDALNVSSNQPTEAVSITGAALPITPAPSSAGSHARNPQAAEVSQVMQMPATQVTPVPPARINTAPPYQTHTPPPMQATVAAPASTQPAYTAVPYAAQPARGVQVNVSRRRGVGIIPAVLALLVGLGLCGVGLWQGRNLLGGSGQGGTPTPTQTVVIAQVPQATQVVQIQPTQVPPTPVPLSPTTQPGGIVIGSPSVPSAQPPPSNTPLPSETPVPPADTPVPPPPTETLAPPATDVPVPPTATTEEQPTPTTELPATEAPTEAPVPPTEVPPTQAPAPPSPVVGGANTVTLQDRSFVGGYTRTDGTYHGVTAKWVYGRGTIYSSMTAKFTVANAPTGAGSLTVRGLDSEDDPKTAISILVNGTQIYTGGNPLPNDFSYPNNQNGPGNWGVYTFTIPAGILQPGANTVTITNLNPSNKINSPPFFMLDYATVSW